MLLTNAGDGLYQKKKTLVMMVLCCKKNAPAITKKSGYAPPSSQCPWYHRLPRQLLFQ
jgi:hypothetical protein